MSGTEQEESLKDRQGWRQAVARYRTASYGRALWQVISTLALYVAMWLLMVWSLRVSYVLTILLAIPAGGLAIRLFVLSHDCGHGSLFPSRRAYRYFGPLLSFLTFVPYYRWKREHAVHHASVGDLDRRGTGDVWTLTVKEYLSLSRLGRLRYRFYRNPLVMMFIGGPFLFVVLYRFPRKGGAPRERMSAYLTDLSLAILWLGM